MNELQSQYTVLINPSSYPEEWDEWVMDKTMSEWMIMWGYTQLQPRYNFLLYPSSYPEQWINEWPNGMNELQPQYTVPIHPSSYLEQVDEWIND